MLKQAACGQTVLSFPRRTPLCPDVVYQYNKNVRRAGGGTLCVFVSDSEKGRPAHRCSAVVQYQRLSRRGRLSPMRIRLFLQRHCRFRIFCKVMHFRVLVKSFCRVVSAL
ncbi:MAG: hypothetical protein ACLRZH_03065 [Ruthenibacterium lactatiformans]